MKKRLCIIDYNNLAYVSIYTKDVLNEGKLLNYEKETFANFLRVMVYKLHYLLKTWQCHRIIVAKDYGSWRKEYYEKYKENREIQRKADLKIDHKLMRKYIDDAYEILKNVYPFIFLRISNAEADDVMYVICKLEKDNFDEIIVFSNDSDMIQLEYMFPNIRRISFKQWKELRSVQPEFEMFLKTFRGDSSDNIPSIKKRVRTTKIKEYFMNKELFESFLKKENLKEQYEKNKKLILFTEIPEDIIKNIEAKYKEKLEKINFSISNWAKYNQMVGEYLINEDIADFSHLDEYWRRFNK